MSAVPREIGLREVVPEATRHREVGFLELALPLLEHWKSLVTVPILAGLLALGGSFLIDPQYTATARMLVPQNQGGLAGMLAQQMGALAGLAGGAAGLKNPADQYIGLLQSRTVADRLLARFDLKTLYDVEFNELARKKLEKRTTIKGGKDGTIAIDVDDESPERAAQIANAYLEELQSLLATLAVTEAGQRRIFFERQLVDAREKLKAAEIALQAVGVSPSTLKVEPRAAVEASARLAAAITAAEVRVGTMSAYMTEGAPELRIARNELAQLRAQLQRVGRPEQDPEGRSDLYVARYRDFKYHEALFELIARQFEMAKLEEAKEGVLVQVVDTAQPPERKSSPQRALIAVITTILVFVVLAVWLEIRAAFRSLEADGSAAEQLARARRVFGR